MPANLTETTVIDASGIHYKQLNKLIRNAIESGASRIKLEGVNGQRFIGAGLVSDSHFEIMGVPGNDLAIFMDGPTIICNGNVQDGSANTMNSGTVVIHGNAGDVLGYGMRGGMLLVKGSVGYRVGIHMKEFGEKVPVMIVGGKAGNFLGEYMAGGVLCVLGLDVPANETVVGNYCGTGMHGGLMFIRQPIEDWQVGKEVGFADVDQDDIDMLMPHFDAYCEHFGGDSANLRQMLENGLIAKLYPFSKRPYGNLYAY